MAWLASIRIFGVDFFCFGKKFLVFNLVSRNVKIKYRRSVLGVFWTLLSPLAQAAVFYFVFKVIMGVDTPHFLAYLLCGILTWSFFAATLFEGMDSIVGGISLVTKVPIPLQVLPYVTALTNLVTLGIAIPILVGASLVSGVELSWSIVLLLPLFLMLFLMVYGISVFMAIGYVFFRDLRHLMGIVMQLWFYATPVVYPESKIPEKYSFIIWLNPIGEIFSSLHDILVGGIWPAPEKLLIASAWTIAAVVIGALVFKRFGHGLVEQL